MSATPRDPRPHLRRRAGVVLAVAATATAVAFPAIGALAQEPGPPTGDTTPTSHTAPEPGQGNPTRILFAVTWQTHDGVVHTSMPVDGVAAGWGTTFELSGTSSKGAASCTYAPGSATLSCDYDNPGHGDEPGLVVPGNPQATFTVVVAGLPDRWRADPSTLGTFVGRVVCPRGGDHDGGHGGGHETLAPAEEHDGGGRHVCTHTVALVEDPPPPTTPPPTPATTAQVAPATESPAAAGAPAVASSARFTG